MDVVAAGRSENACPASPPRSVPEADGIACESGLGYAAPASKVKKRSMATLLLLPALVVAATLALAAMAKLSDRQPFATELIGFGLPSQLARELAILVPLAELSVAIAFIPAQSARWAAVAAFSLLTILTAVLVSARRRGLSGGCNCFGTVAVASGGKRALARNGVLAGLCVLAFWFDADGGSAIAPGARAAMMGAVIAVTVLAVALVRRASWTPRAGSKGGGTAPVLVFEGLDGETIDLRRTARRTLLLFWTPGCAPCQYMAPRLRAWESARPEGAPQLVIVAEGSAEANRSAGLHSPISLDPSSQTLRAFGLPGRPSAVIVEPGATFDSAPLLGAPAILAALGAPP
jgi:thiol-disulfide isomerase/thioredoxin